MKDISKIDPETTHSHPGLLASYTHPDKQTKFYHIFLIDTHIVIMSASDYTSPEGDRKLLSYQIEFPKAGLAWFIESVKRFFLSEEEGGIPHGKMSVKTCIDGEHLQVFRAANADHAGGGGYALITLDRKEHTLGKKLVFRDDYLFEFGLMDLLTDIAENKL